MADDPTLPLQADDSTSPGLQFDLGRRGIGGAPGLGSAGPPTLTTLRPAAGVVDIWPMPDQGRTDHEVCPFLRSVGPDDRLTDPIDVPDPANRCAAMADAVPQSLRQQELVCLTTAHSSCPRYLRGATVEIEAPVGRTITVSRSDARDDRRPRPVGGGLQRLGRLRPGSRRPGPAGRRRAPRPRAPSASPVAEVPSASALGGSERSRALRHPEPVRVPHRLRPSPTAEPSPTPAPTPAPTATPAPTSDRYALLKPCPDTPDCWIYRVRSGDNLFSIAKYFGVPLATVKALNPWTANGLRAGRDLILPPPTR